jgi:hypothetical protein
LVLVFDILINLKATLHILRSFHTFELIKFLIILQILTLKNALKLYKKSLCSLIETSSNKSKVQNCKEWKQDLLEIRLVIIQGPINHINEHAEALGVIFVSGAVKDMLVALVGVSTYLAHLFVSVHLPLQELDSVVADILPLVQSEVLTVFL